MEDIPRLEITVNDNKTINARFYLSSSSTTTSATGDGIFQPKEEEITIIKLLIDQLKFLINDQIFANDEGTRRAASIYLNRLIMQLGKYLYAALFPGEVERILNVALKSNERLRIELEFDKSSERYAEWPWEYLYKPEDDNSKGDCFLIREQRNVIRKRPTSAKIEDVPKPKVLLIISDPTGYAVNCRNLQTRLTLFRELDYIDLKVIDKNTTVDIGGGRSFPVASRKYLGARLQEQFDIIHFVGHGKCDFEGASIALNDGNGDPDWIPGKLFAEWVRASKPKLVFLQACETALSDFENNIKSTALLLVEKDIPAVVAMQYKIRDDVATECAEKFYIKLIEEQQTVDIAAKESRVTIDSNSDALLSLAFGLLVLYLSHYKSVRKQKKVEDKKGKEQSQLVSTGSRQENPTLLGAQNTETKQVNCPDCNAVVTPGVDNFCSGCGKNLSLFLLQFCPNCGQKRQNNQNFCNKCGTKLPPLQTQDSNAIPDEKMKAGANKSASSAEPGTTKDTFIGSPMPPIAPGLPGRASSGSNV